jgi:hypothetical protein
VNKLVCHGPAPGVIDCVGTSKDGGVINATLTAQANQANCHGPLVVDVAGKPIATLADVACH